MTSQRPRRSSSTSPLGTPLARKQSGPFSCRAVGRRPQATIGTKATDGDAKSGTRSDKRGSKWWPQGVTVATSCDEGDNDNDASDSNEDHFKKLLKATCPNHTYPVRHKLKECTMMDNYMTT
jgi:hypothetical protein